MPTQMPDLEPMLESLCIIIPAFEPAAVLPLLVRALRSSGVGLVVLVDDGSAAASQPMFQQAAQEGAHVLRHAVNLGKGRALKTAFNYILAERPDIYAVVTADADGQHSAKDIIRVALTVQRVGEPVLGSRAFAGAVPLRSRIGNTLTRAVFGLITGTRLIDTQTGLRGLPRDLLPHLVSLDGERYEYEMNMLAFLCQGQRLPVEVPIHTIYIEDNRSSHFNPVWDSMRIYFVLARFVLSAAFAAALDLLLFTVTYALTSNIAWAVGIGRTSSMVNFALNRRFVFRNRGGFWRTLLEYYLLAAAVAFASFGAISIAAHRWHWHVIVAKVLVDSVLSLVSFSVQRTLIFCRSSRVREGTL